MGIFDRNIQFTSFFDSFMLDDFSANIIKNLMSLS